MTELDDELRAIARADQQQARVIEFHRAMMRNPDWAKSMLILFPDLRVAVEKVVANLRDVFDKEPSDGR